MSRTWDLAYERSQVRGCDPHQQVYITMLLHTHMVTIPERAPMHHANAITHTSFNNRWMGHRDVPLNERCDRHPLTLRITIDHHG